MAKALIINRCGDCPHNGSSGYDIECRHDGPMKTATVKPDSLPKWCPLQDEEPVGVLVPLEWTAFLPVSGFDGEFTNGYEVSRKRPKGRWWWQYRQEAKRSCASLEDGKAACEAHYRARMFAPGGPLRKIGEGK